jgi:hypothetical protein
MNMMTFDDVNIEKVDKAVILTALSMGGYGIVLTPADRAEMNEMLYVEE